MTPAALALPSGLFRLQCHLKYLLLPSSIPTIKAFSSSMVLDTEETPAMKALKDIPYPSASPDPSIFESRSGEYDRVRLPAVLAQRMASSRRADQRYQWYASHVLERLARSDKFEEAEQVRQDLAEMNVPIRLSGDYLRVAWHVLRQRPWPPNRTEIFTNWLSLLPSVASDKIPLRFALLKSALLFNSQHLDLKTIAQFGIVLSSKGYIRGVSASVVACLTRYADPNASLRVLDEILAANDDYIRSKLGTARTKLVRNHKNTTKRLWGIAIRTHCTAGRPEVAFQMAKRADERNIRLTTFTYKYLLGKLDANGLDDLAAEIRAHPCCGSLDVTKSRPTVDDSIPTSIPPISRKQSMIVNQAIALAILERRSRSGLPAHAVDIVPYFDIYKTHLRGGRDANMLRSRAYRISLTALSTVLLAELLHHLRRGQFIHVLWVFEKYFQVVGVPSEDITRRLWKREHYPPKMQIPPRYIPLRITKTTFNIPYKLWPTSYHTALVWSALVHLCESEEEVFALYDSLLQHSAQFQKTTVSHQHLHHHPSHDSSSSTLEFVLGTADKFDAAHFRPFLIPFTHLRDAKYSLRVLDDMQDHGIAPSAQFLSTAAALQARFGDPALALRILDVVRGQVERHGDEGADVDLEIEMGAESGVRERDKKQQQLRVAYTSVLRGFIDRRDIVRARQVAELLHSHLGYVEGRGCSGGNTGGNARTDVALRFLRRLEVEGPRVSLTDSEVDADYFYPFLKKPDHELIKTLNASPGAKRGRR
ncbi:hypothetical protein BGY98DRAFT_975734 [Russula aff. rugulosa BPL654]|nr:hypothetical protein BGY98DRAFT_975734 [Russula aff. rugulosa BPL654]